jgi:hypothetical protein
MHQKNQRRSNVILFSRCSAQAWHQYPQRGFIKTINSTMLITIMDTTQLQDQKLANYIN